MGLFSRQKGDEHQFKKDFNKAAEILYFIGDKLDFYPEYQDRFLLIQ